MRGSTLSRVVFSRSEKFPVGSYVDGRTCWTEYAVVNAKDIALLAVPENGKPTDALGVLGMTGLTAYFGITDSE